MLINASVEMNTQQGISTKMRVWMGKETQNGGISSLQQVKIFVYHFHLIIYKPAEVPPFGMCVDATYASIPVGKYINRKACLESCRHGGHSSSALVYGECKCGAQEEPSDGIDCSVDAECKSYNNHVCFLGTDAGDSKANIIWIYSVADILPIVYLIPRHHWRGRESCWWGPA